MKPELKIPVTGNPMQPNPLVVELAFDQPLAKEMEGGWTSYTYTVRKDGVDHVMFASAGLHRLISEGGYRKGSVIQILKLLAPGADPKETKWYVEHVGGVAPTPGQPNPPAQGQARPPLPPSQSAPAQARPAPSQPPPSQGVYYPRNEGDWSLYKVLLAENVHALALCREAAGLGEEPLVREDGVSIFIETNRNFYHWRGSTVAGGQSDNGQEAPNLSDRERAILNIDRGNIKNALLAEIAAQHHHLNAGAHTANVLKLFGFNASHIDPQDTDTWLNLARVAWDYADLREMSVDEYTAVVQVADKYGVPHEVLTVAPPAEKDEAPF
jgi:hypothetical protein